ncbi:disulfide bond formation protein B [Phenylobacterium sp.]|uniref:disulfide bond formation protein B n=1 Tax=Phenylobacterium sp. TaxID=1871053 RepID=UPI0035B189F3
MPNVLNPILDRWRLAALAASAAMLATAHAFETFGGLAPCTLCLRQREVYWVAATVAAVGMILTRLPKGERLRALFNAALGLIFLAGAGVAIYHAGAEWKFWPGPTACSGGGGASAEALSSLMQGAKIRPPACDEPAWVFLGLSMAGWNALASLGLAGLSLAAVMRERSKR